MKYSSIRVRCFARCRFFFFFRNRPKKILSRYFSTRRYFSDNYFESLAFLVDKNFIDLLQILVSIRHIDSTTHSLDYKYPNKVSFYGREKKGIRYTSTIDREFEINKSFSKRIEKSEVSHPGGKCKCENLFSPRTREIRPEKGQRAIFSSQRYLGRKRRKAESDGRRVSSKNKRKSSTRVSISSANLDERSVLLLSPYLWYQRSAPHGSDALPSFDFLNPTRDFLYVDREETFPSLFLSPVSLISQLADQISYVFPCCRPFPRLAISPSTRFFLSFFRFPFLFFSFLASTGFDRYCVT